MADLFISQKFSGLELLPTHMLEEIIQADFNGDVEYDTEMIAYVLEVISIRKREEKSEKIPDAQASWESLQMHICSIEESDIDLNVPETKDHRKRNRVLRYVAVVAACIAGVFALMITVQAMGVDVFGALAKWTDSTFQFVRKESSSTTATTRYNPATNEMRDILLEMEMPTQLAPTWIPEEYALVSVDPCEIDGMKSVYAVYSSPNVEQHLTIDIWQVTEDELLYNTLFEKDSIIPEIYTNNGKSFYLFTNAGYWTATWTDEECVVTICGASTKETVVAMIDSIKE